MSGEEKIDGAFEDNLRQILSNDNAADTPAAFVPDQEAIDRMKAERRTLFLFKLLRPVAAAAALIALALFVARITAAR